MPTNLVDAYIKTFQPSTQKILTELRKIILEVAPNATEKMSYGMPAFALNGKPLVYFAGLKSHIGFYPTPSGVKAFEGELKKQGYKYSKGAIQFPLSRPVPYGLVKQIVLYKAEELHNPPTLL